MPDRLIFVGLPIDGYEAPIYRLTHSAAAALVGVQTTLRDFRLPSTADAEILEERAGISHPLRGVVAFHWWTSPIPTYFDVPVR